MEEGTLAGFPLLDVKVTLMDGGFHAVDSSAIASNWPLKLLIGNPCPSFAAAA